MSILSLPLLTLILAEGDSPSWFPWWLNYPGFEAWKFFNLFLFVGVMVYLLRRPIGTAMLARRAGIRRDLNRAREERDAALSKLKDVELRLQRLDEEVAMVRRNAEQEAASEAERIKLSTDDDAQKFKEQARREIESVAKAARQELQRYAAQQSVDLARSLIKQDIRADDDSRLYDQQIEEFGGLRH